MVRVPPNVERPVTRRQVSGTPGFGNVLKASVPLELTRDRGTKVDSQDVLNVHEVLQLMPMEMMLFYHEAVPVRSSAGKHHARERIAST